MVDLDMAVFPATGGRALRLVTSGEDAALFNREGIVKRLKLTAPAAAPQRLPEVVSLEGQPVSLRRASKPCSCSGYPWNAPAASLRSLLTASFINEESGQVTP